MRTRSYEYGRTNSVKRTIQEIGSFKKLFSLSKDIPYWLISYNDRSYPDIQTLVDLIRPYRKVSIDRKLYQTGRGGKGSVAGSNEILLVCEP